MTSGPNFENRFLPHPEALFLTFQSLHYSHVHAALTPHPRAPTFLYLLGSCPVPGLINSTTSSTSSQRAAPQQTLPCGCLLNSEPRNRWCFSNSPAWLPILWCEPCAPSKGEILGYIHVDSSAGVREALAADGCAILHTHCSVQATCCASERLAHAHGVQMVLGGGMALKCGRPSVSINDSFKFTFSVSSWYQEQWSWALGSKVAGEYKYTKVLEKFTLG